MMETFELFALKQWPARQVAQRCGVSVDTVYQKQAANPSRVRELLPRVQELW